MSFIENYNTTLHTFDSVPFGQQPAFGVDHYLPTITEQDTLIAALTSKIAPFEPKSPDSACVQSFSLRRGHSLIQTQETAHFSRPLLNAYDCVRRINANNRLIEQLNTKISQYTSTPSALPVSPTISSISRRKPRINKGLQEASVQNKTDAPQQIKSTDVPKNSSSLASASSRIITILSMLLGT